MDLISVVPATSAERITQIRDETVAAEVASRGGNIAGWMVKDVPHLVAALRQHIA